MKKSTRLATIFGALLFGLTGCGDYMGECAPSADMRGGAYESSSVDKESGDSGYSESGYFDGGEKDDYKSDGDVGTGEELEEKQINAGQLTAKALFDNEDQYYPYFYSLLQKDSQTNGEFANYQDRFKLDYKRLKVSVKNAPYAEVALLDNQNNEVWNTIADVNGNCYLFSNTSGAKVKVTANNETKIYDAVDNLVIEDFTLDTEKYNKIQILFDIDTTGSMGDEIKYLKAEMSDVIARIESETQAEAEVGFVYYRDKGDGELYLTKEFDFTNDLDSALASLNSQFAGGGGDFEEAVQESYRVAKQLNWIEDTTKVIVHVADAPGHDSDVADWFESVKYFAGQGAHILTVASSGIDKKTEYFFRMQSLQTNGCYAYLTNDSGIGGDHLEASVVDEIATEYLNDLLVRVIKGFHNGKFDEPKAFDISEYPELLYLNKRIHMNKQVQSSLVKKYIDQYCNEETKETAKAGIKYYYTYEKMPFVYFEDNFLGTNEIKTTCTYNHYSITYTDSIRQILMFNGKSFLTIDEALQKDAIDKTTVEKLLAKLKTLKIFDIDIK